MTTLIEEFKLKTKDVQKMYSDYILPTYTQLPVCLVKGKGSWVWDLEGKKYLDFFPGWAVSGLGHCHPAVVSAIKEQSKKVIHIPNNFLNLTQARLAKTIVEHSFPGKLFFSNSGAEAVEVAIKFAKKFGAEKKRSEIITFKQSFHGRSYAAMSASGQDVMHDGFKPLVQGFKYATFNDFDSVKKLVTSKTAAILLEPIQGEGGIHVATGEFVKNLRKLCNDKKILLIFDEVQTGMGRTGKMFAFQHLKVKPDIMTMAKSLGGGVPIGATLVSNKVKNVLTPGSHGSTYGGNPLVSRASLAVFEAIKKESLLEKTQELGDYLKLHLEKLQRRYPVVKEIRGRGLMLGMELSITGKPVVDECLKQGLIINVTQGNILRILPAMTVTKKQVDTAMNMLDYALSKWCHAF